MMSAPSELGLRAIPHNSDFRDGFMAHSTGVRLALVVALAGSVASAAFGSNVSFSKVAAFPDRGGLHADLNSDGREDFVTINGNTGQFGVVLSTGDGKYAAVVPYSIPGGADATTLMVVDFNSDGKADLVVGGSDKALHLFVNNGSGRFSQKAVVPKWVGVINYASAVGDFNHDGHLDLVFLNDIGDSVIVWFGNGKGGFTLGPRSVLSSMPESEFCDNHIRMGDFDGDGRADLLCDGIENSDATVLYGDGTGHFPQHALIPSSSLFEGFEIADVDGDGKMDVIKHQNNPQLASISVLYGSATRKWTRTATIFAQHVVLSVAAADLNGDGINDLIVDEFEVSPSFVSTYDVGVLIRNSNGSYQQEQIVASGTNADFGSVIRANRDSKPDLSLFGSILLNTTVGNFPTCAAPNAFEGINVCSPAAGATVTSPVSFKAGAAGQVPMRDVEVWIDGKKLGGQVDGFSNYTFLNRSTSLSKGTHTVGIFAAGWDQSLEKRTFTLKVK